MKIAIAAFILILNGYFFYIFGVQEPEQIVIYDELRIVDNQGLTIDCNPHLQRTRKDGIFQIYIEESWDHQSIDNNSFKLSNGTTVEIEADFIDTDGNLFKPHLSWACGSDECCLEFLFDPEIPKRSDINKIFLKSSKQLHCKKIIWFCYNAP